MTSLLYHPLPDSTMATLASLANDVPGVFADFLCDPEHVGTAWFGMPLAQRKWDVLAWFLRDERTCPDAKGIVAFGDELPPDNIEWANIPNPDRLFPGTLPPAALGAWLRAVGDECWRDVHRLRVWQDKREYEAAYWRVSDGLTRLSFFATEPAAWLDLKRRVAGLFGELVFYERQRMTPDEAAEKMSNPEYQHTTWDVDADAPIVTNVRQWKLAYLLPIDPEKLQEIYDICEQVRNLQLQIAALKRPTVIRKNRVRKTARDKR